MMWALKVTPDADGGDKSRVAESEWCPFRRLGATILDVEHAESDIVEHGPDRLRAAIGGRVCHDRLALGWFLYRRRCFVE